MKESVSIYIEQEKLEARIKEVAEQINKDYAGESVCLLCILKGSVMFMSELAKSIKVPVTMDFIQVSSYGSGTVSTGIVRMIKDLDASIEGKNVIIIEDIVDSGNTLSYLIKNLTLRKPKTLKVCSLLEKPSRRIATDFAVDYKCFDIDDYFVVGYGLDYDQRYRNLPYIGIVSFEE